MQAIIPAAGMGRRLKKLTKDCAKCMIKINGISLIERMLAQLDRLDLSRIVIIVGYQDEKLIEFISCLNVATPVKYVKNPIYETTNNIYSLALAKDYLIMDDTIILESDLIFEDGILKELINDKRDTLALVDKYESWMDGTVIKIDGRDSITDMISGSKMDFADDDYYKTVNIYKFSQHFSAACYVPFLEAYLQVLGNNQYYEQVLRIIAILDEPMIKAKRLSGQTWYEIDNIQDIDIASSLFEPDAGKKLELMQKRYGGYWRYPKLLDFCYLVNPFFPSDRAINEIKLNFEELICAYPSGLKVNSMLAAKKFDVEPCHIIMGNGAAELIKTLMGLLSGNIGFIFPTFEEYPNRCVENRKIVFVPQNDDLSYTTCDIINYYDNKNIEALLIINPDNPSGNYICKDDINKLLDWTSKKNIKLIIDESFADFADEYPNTLIDAHVISKYKNLIVIKSISKSYGVPGLRLGALVSYDVDLVDKIKNDMPIWNINSFAEFYMQIEEKYKNDYESSLNTIRKVRANYISEIKTINNIRVIPSQANYIMAEILGGITSRELVKDLLLKYNILIKDLSSKMGFKEKQFVRMAIRSDEDNNKLIFALKEILCDK